MKNNQRNQRSRHHQWDDRDDERRSSRYYDRDHDAMHQRNWNQGGDYHHGDNFGLGDTSQGSANYGTPDRGRGARYYGTGAMGGYFGGRDNDYSRDDDYRQAQYYGDRNPGSSMYRDDNQRSFGNQGRYSDWDRRRQNWQSRNYGDRTSTRRWDDDRDWWDKTTDEVASWFGDDDAQRRREMDKRFGGHAGKGPKGYTRSDEKIKDEVEEALYHDDYVDASDIEVSVENGEVTLKGTTNDRGSKRRAEYCAESVSGVYDVTNNIKVKREDSSFSNYGVAGTTGIASGTTASNITNVGDTSNTDSLDQSRDLVREKNK